MKKPTLSPAEICQVFGISKATLLRWEREGDIPAADRNAREERRYSAAHTQAIASNLYSRAARSSNAGALEELTEVSSLCKLLAGNELGLDELEEKPSLSERTIKGLLSLALQLGTSDKEFARIIEVLWSHMRPTHSARRT